MLLGVAGIVAVKVGSKGRAAGVGRNEQVPHSREDTDEPLQTSG